MVLSIFDIGDPFEHVLNICRKHSIITLGANLYSSSRRPQGPCDLLLFFNAFRTSFIIWTILSFEILKSIIMCVFKYL